MPTSMKFLPKKEKRRVFSQVKIISQDLTTEGLFTKVSRQKKKPIKKTWNRNNQITDSTENVDVKKAALLPRQTC